MIISSRPGTCSRYFAALDLECYFEPHDSYDCARPIARLNAERCNLATDQPISTCVKPLAWQYATLCVSRSILTFYLYWLRFL